jgi:hypothetical protein
MGDTAAAREAAGVHALARNWGRAYRSIEGNRAYIFLGDDSFVSASERDALAAIQHAVLDCRQGCIQHPFYILEWHST